MHLIIAEKNIAAQRISEILSGKKKISNKKDGGVNQYIFDDTVTIGLRGHVVGVDFVDGYTNWRSVERPPRSLIEAGILKRPTEPSIVKIIQRLSKKADRVTIATDFDTEGELIGKEAYELVKAVNPDVPVDRAKFSAITNEEINNAFSKPAAIDFDLAAAGEARQVIDLIWGASLTRFISLTAKRSGANILSVGRVQSPTLALIVDREREIESFIPEPYWEIGLVTEKNKETFSAHHENGRFTDKTEAEKAYKSTKEPLTVLDVKEGSRIDRAPTPFDTTSYIVAAARIGLSAANAMRIAEELYMNGYISYPRTDNTIYPPSLNLNVILDTLEKSQFKKDVEWVKVNRRKVPTQGKKSSTDHPPIHPTGAATPEKLADSWKVYELIVRRFLATLSPDARWTTLKITMDASGEKYISTGSRLTEIGWRMVYPYSDAKDSILPEVKKGERLPILDLALDEKFTQPPARYSQSKLIQVMEELSLGTKSTRHEIIQKLISRKYIEGNPLKPTLVGRAVTDSLEAHAGEIARPEMTSSLEAAMEGIKTKKQTQDFVLKESRTMLSAVFDELEPNQEQIGKEIIGQTDEELTIGPCPVCGNDLRIKTKGGSQFIGCRGYPDCSFNLSLPGTMWGSAVRTKNVCEKHHLFHVLLVSKGARPWEIGCPLCSQIEQQNQFFEMMPSMTEDLRKKLIDLNIISISEMAKTDPAYLVKNLKCTPKVAGKLNLEAIEVLSLLRTRSECKKFMKQFVPPKRGRSHSKVMKGLTDAGLNSIDDIASSSVNVLKTIGLTDSEAESLYIEAVKSVNKAKMKEIGVSTTSLNKYQQAGFFTQELMLKCHPAYISLLTGVSIETIHKHQELIAQALSKSVPEKISKKKIEIGREELLSIPGIDEGDLAALYKLGIYNKETLITADNSKIKQLEIAPDRLKKIKSSILKHKN